MNKVFTIFILILLLSSLFSTAQAQTTSPLPEYVVQPGDTLGAIAQLFGLSMDEIIRVNALPNPNTLSVGMRLVIPGLGNITGTLVAQVVPVGDSLRSILLHNPLPEKLVLKLNHLTSPDEVFAGVKLVLAQPEDQSQLVGSAVLNSGQSLLELAIRQNQNPWEVLSQNQLSSPARLLPNDVVFKKKSGDDTTEVSSVSPHIKRITISPLPLVQGRTVSVRVFTTKPLALSGKLFEKDLRFFEEKQNQYVALTGVHALAQPGLADLSLTISANNEPPMTYQENLLLKSGVYSSDAPLMVDPKTIDPAATKPEEDQIKQILEPYSTNKYWDGKFKIPVDEPICIKSSYGNRRTYNSDPQVYFHTGLDFGVCKNLNIYAPAAGKIVFAGPLTVRGNATIIDHGWGVYSGYWHQKEINVKVGEVVKPGQLIGLIGGTGRVTGPHLHWEIVVNGIQVEPWDWIEKSFPY